ncbi:hypothetical protein vseg_008630 [Gypsophila vaccaria]
MAKVITLLVIFASLSLHCVFGVSSPITLKTKNGQTYRCVDFYKQPAFRGLPLNLEVMPSIAKLQYQKVNLSDFGLESLGCPIGTVPILDIGKTKIQIIREELDPRPYSKLRAKEHCRATVQTIYDEKSKFFGGSGGVSIYKPIVKSGQWSSSRIKLVNGFESIEAGWMVNPTFFKDNEAHLYASFNIGGTGCINLACPGFVQVPSDVAIGISPSSYSTVKQQIFWKVSIAKHQDDGNWWVSLIFNNENIPLGYWPQTLFTALRDGAFQVEFGGEINDPRAAEPPPGMGNGLQSVYDTALSAAFLQATVVDQSFNNIDPPNTQKFQDCSKLYTVKDAGNQGGDFGRIILFGGPRSS